IASSPPSLEAEFHAELHDARGARLRLDAAERAGAQIGAWIAPVEMVQEVERLRPQLKTVARTEVDVSRKGQIDAPEGRADQRVPDVVAESSGCRLRKRGGIQVAVQRAAVHIVVELVGALPRLAVEGTVAAARDVQPAARTRADDRRRAPVGDDRAESGGADGWRLDADRKRGEVSSILVAVPAVSLRVVRVGETGRCLQETTAGEIPIAPGQGVVAVQAHATGIAALERELEPAILLRADVREQIEDTDLGSRRGVFTRQGQAAAGTDVGRCRTHRIRDPEQGTR